MKLCWPTSWYSKQRLVDEVNRLNDRVETLTREQALTDATLVRVETERLALERRVRDEQNEGDPSPLEDDAGIADTSKGITFKSLELT